jgi:uncharacterized protein with FMN-binding domain
MSTRPSASLGRRLLPAVAMTTAASGLVALLDQPSSGAAVNLGGNTSVLPDQGAAAGSGQPPAVSSTLPAVAAQPVPTVAPLAPVPVQQPVAAPTPAQQPVATPAPAATTPKAAGGSCQGQKVDGQTVSTRWGPVQVEAVVSASGQICNIDAIQYPNSHGRSVQINNYALPILHKQVMKAQSTNINGVSGATITSVGYDRSLQSILDKLG